MNHETRLQIKVIEHLSVILRPEVVFWHTPNGGEATAEQRKLQARLGELPGVPDLTFLSNAPLTFIELKVQKSEIFGVPKTTYQSKVQRAFQERVEPLGALYFVCRTVAEVEAALLRAGVPTKLSRASS
jgi:hypothetical protein